MRNKFCGSILVVRAVEDTIRATKKYSEVRFTKFKHSPIQGADFPSKILTKRYEVYPEMEVGWNMSFIDAVFWVAGETPHIDIDFWYDYLHDKAAVIIYGGNGVVNLLKEGIPDFEIALAKVVENGQNAH